MGLDQSKLHDIAHHTWITYWHVFSGNASSGYQPRRGLMKIAQQFTAGMAGVIEPVSPVGTTEQKSSNAFVFERLSRPYRTLSWFRIRNPAINRWAIIECPYGTTRC